jgi:hypothetical protein
MLRVFALVSATMLLGACASLATQQSAPQNAAVVRVVDGRTYRVIRAEPLYLYELDRLVPSGKRVLTVADRYFSTAADAPLHALTLNELKRAYPDNHKFHDILSIAFANDAELTRWDAFHHEYLVARLLRQTLPAGTVVGAR